MSSSFVPSVRSHANIPLSMTTPSSRRRARTVSCPYRSPPSSAVALAVATIALPSSCGGKEEEEDVVEKEGSADAVVATSFVGRRCTIVTTRLLSHGEEETVAGRKRRRRDRLDEPMLPMVCTVDFPRDVEAVALTTATTRDERTTEQMAETTTTTKPLEEVALLCATRDGRLWRSEVGKSVAGSVGRVVVRSDEAGKDVDIDGEAPFRMVPCIDAGGLDRERGDDDDGSGARPLRLPLGSNVLSVLSIGQDEERRGGASSTAAKGGGGEGRGGMGTLLVAAGATLEPPAVIHLLPPPPSLSLSEAQRIGGEKKRPRGIDDNEEETKDDGDRDLVSSPHCRRCPRAIVRSVPGLDQVDARATAVLLLPRPTPALDARRRRGTSSSSWWWDNLANACCGVCNGRGDLTPGKDNTDVVFLGFEDGTVRASFVAVAPFPDGSLSTEDGNSSSHSPFVRVGAATIVFRLRRDESVLSLLQFPSSNGSSTRVICVGSLGTVAILDEGTTTGLNNWSAAGFQIVEPSLPRIGVWTSAAPAVSRTRSRAPPEESDERNPREFDGVETESSLSLVATCDDGSTYLYSVDIEHEESDECNGTPATSFYNQAASRATMRLTSSSVLRLPVRREMALVSCASYVRRRTGCTTLPACEISAALAFFTHRDSLSVMEMKNAQKDSSSFQSVASFGDRKGRIGNRNRKKRRSMGVLHAILSENSGRNAAVDVTPTASKHPNYRAGSQKLDFMLGKLSQMTGADHGSCYNKGVGLRPNERIHLESSSENDVDSALQETREMARTVSSILVSLSPLTGGRTGRSSTNATKGPLLKCAVRSDPSRKQLVAKVSLGDRIPHNRLERFRGWDRSCHIIQSLPSLSSSLLQPPSVDSMIPLCHRPIAGPAFHDSPAMTSRKGTHEKTIKVVYSGTVVSTSESVLSSFSEGKQCHDCIPAWDRYPVLTYSTLSSTFVYTTTNTDSGSWHRSKHFLSYPARKRTRRAKRTHQAQPFSCAGFAKRARLGESSTSMCDCLGLVAPLDSTESDILDSTTEGSASERNDLHAKRNWASDTSAEHIIRSWNQRRASLPPSQKKLNSALPADREDRLVRQFAGRNGISPRTNHTDPGKRSSILDAAEQAFNCCSSSIAVMNASTLKGFLFNSDANHFCGPLLGLDACSLVLCEPKATENNTRKLGFAAGSELDPNELGSIVPLVRSSLLRRLALGQGGGTVITLSEGDAARVLSLYQERLRSRQGLKVVKYLKRALCAQSSRPASNGGNDSDLSPEATIRLYSLLRALELVLT